MKIALERMKTIYLSSSYMPYYLTAYGMTSIKKWCYRFQRTPMLTSMLINKSFKTGIWKASSRTASQSEAMLENPC